MSAPALIWLALAFIGLMISAHMHGKPETGKHSVWLRIVGLSIAGGLLYWGGFFASVPA
jgi:LPXTG-motif cell wall-anchored protein